MNNLDVKEYGLEHSVGQGDTDELHHAEVRDARWETRFKGSGGKLADEETAPGDPSEISKS